MVEPAIRIVEEVDEGTSDWAEIMGLYSTEEGEGITITEIITLNTPTPDIRY